MPKVSTKDWRNLPIEDWNTTTFHEYLIEKNRELYNVSYLPFGRGPVSKRWSTEKGQLKGAIEASGTEVVKRYIDRCFESHRYNPQYPCLPFGFMFAYKRDELVRAEQDVRHAIQAKQAEIASDATEVDEGWF